MVDRLVDGRAVRSVKGFIRGCNGGAADSFGFFWWGLYVYHGGAAEKAKLFLEAPREFYHFICYSAMHDMSTGLGCSFLVHIKEACKAIVSGIRLFGERISM